MDWLTNPQIWIAFVTLVALELVLGVDNVIFISILAGKLPAHQQKRARRTGLALAVISRILLLFSLSWIIGLTAPLLSVLNFEISGRDIVLFLGGVVSAG
jgi:predicted tellurium resistance membrane protein TerC